LPDSAVNDVESRSRFLEKSLLAAGALVGGGVLVGGFPNFAASAPSPEQDVEILNFALLLEYTEFAFYSEALSRGGLSGDLLEYATTVRRHEQAHVAFLERALGSKARAKPTFAFGDTTSDPDKFASTAATLEDSVVAAYNGQATNLTKKTLVAAAKIVSVEARHAGWIRAIVGEDPAPDATDTPQTPAQVTAALKRARLLK
jgi:Ferritin-like domain